MPKSKDQKRLEVLEKLEAQYLEEIRTDISQRDKNTFSYTIGYRANMLLTQINNIRAKLNYSPFQKELHYVTQPVTLSQPIESHPGRGPR